MSLQLQDDSKLIMANSPLKNMKEYAIRMESQKYLSDCECKTGSTELLEKMSEISLQGCKFENNGKGDVLLKSQTSTSLLAKSEEMISWKFFKHEN